MVNHAKAKFAASFLVLSLMANPAAYAAAENTPGDKPSQTEPETKSYLPPWMQGQGGADNGSTAGKNSPAAGYGFRARDGL